MTLYELLKASPLVRIARQAAQEEAIRPRAEKQRRARTRRYLYFLGVLLDTKPTDAGRYILVNTPYCDGSLWTWEAALIEAEDFALLMDRHPSLSPYNRDALRAMTPEELAACEGTLRDILPPAVDYALLPWEDVLGAEVRFPASLGQPYLLAFLSSVIRTMSYAGFTKKQQDDTRQRLLAFMKARGEIKRLSTEEMEKRQSSLRTLFPAPPDEEQKETDRALLIDTILSLEGEYKMYKSLAE